jgi:hypothetical protein
MADMSTKRPELTMSDTVRELPLACTVEIAAVEFLERQRWGDTPCCVHCGSTNVYQMSSKDQRARGFLLLRPFVTTAQPFRGRGTALYNDCTALRGRREKPLQWSHEPLQLSHSRSSRRRRREARPTASSSTGGTPPT